MAFNSLEDAIARHPPLLRAINASGAKFNDRNKNFPQRNYFGRRP